MSSPANIATFLEERIASWEELDRLLGKSAAAPERLGADGVRRLGTLYRAAVADLAYARRRFPTAPETARLEQLVIRARSAVYRRRPVESFVAFWATGYWREIAARPAVLGVAFGLLVASVAFGWIWAAVDPSNAVETIPQQLRSAVDPGPTGTDNELRGADQAAFSAFLFTHNTTVSFWAFALGITAGIGTAWIVLSNGLLFGVVGGILVGNGDGAFFVELVAAHGVLELSAIVVAAYAGLRMGWALVDSAGLPRAEALAAEGRASVKIVLGTVPWLAVAGLIEAFVSRRGFSAGPMAIVGLGVGAVYWWLVWARGRLRRVPSTWP